MVNEEYLQVWKAYMGRTQHAGAAAVLTLLHVLDMGPHRTYTVACGEAVVPAPVEAIEPAPVVEAEEPEPTKVIEQPEPAPQKVEADEWGGLLKAYKLLKGENAVK
jgi:hypothetical protein